MSTFPWNLNKESYRMQILSGIPNIVDPNDVTITYMSSLYHNGDIQFNIQAGSSRGLIISTTGSNTIYNKSSAICPALDLHTNNKGMVKITCLQIDGSSDDIILQELKSIHSKLDTLLEQKAIS